MSPEGTFVPFGLFLFTVVTTNLRNTLFKPQPTVLALFTLLELAVDSLCRFRNRDRCHSLFLCSPHFHW